MILSKQLLLAISLFLFGSAFVQAGPIVPDAYKKVDVGVIEASNQAYDWSPFIQNDSITFEAHYEQCMTAALDYVENGIRCKFAGRLYFVQKPQGTLRMFINGEVTVHEDISGVSAKRICKSRSEASSINDLIVCRFRDRLIYTNQFELPDFEAQ